MKAPTDQTRLAVRVTPRASSNAVVRYEGDALSLRLTAPLCRDGLDGPGLPQVRRQRRRLATSPDDRPRPAPQAADPPAGGDTTDSDDVGDNKPGTVLSHPGGMAECGLNRLVLLRLPLPTVIKHVLVEINYSRLHVRGWCELHISL